MILPSFCSMKFNTSTLPSIRLAWSPRFCWVCFSLLCCTSASDARATLESDISSILQILNTWQQAGNVASVPYQWPNGWTLGEYLTYFFDTTPMGLPTFSTQLRNVIGPLYSLTNQPAYSQSLSDITTLLESIDDETRDSIIPYLYDIHHQVSDINGSSGDILSILNDVHNTSTRRIRVDTGDLSQDITTSFHDNLDYLGWSISNILSDVIYWQRQQFATNLPPQLDFEQPEPYDYTEEQYNAALEAEGSNSETENEMSDYVGDEDNWLPQWEWSTYLPGSTDPLTSLRPSSPLSDMSSTPSAIYITDSEISSSVVHSATIPVIRISNDHAIWRKNLPSMQSVNSLVRGIWLLGAAVAVFLKVRREWDYYMALGRSSTPLYEPTLAGGDTLETIPVLDAEPL